MQNIRIHSFLFLFLITTSMSAQLSQEKNHNRIPIENELLKSTSIKNEVKAGIDTAFFSNIQLQKIPGQYIIRYKSVIKYSPRGNDILHEYDIIIRVIEQLSQLKVKKYKAVNPFLVSKMVKENLTELEVAASIHNNNQKNNKYRISSTTDKIKEYNSARVMTISFDTNEYTANIIDRIKNSSSKFIAEGIEILDIEPNNILSTNFYPNDTYFNRQWGHTLINSLAAWDMERGSSDIVIGVIDTGIDTNHEDLKDNINKTLEYDFVDIDTTAYIAQEYTLLPREDYKDRDSIAIDYNGHGTHCAGIIGAKGNNSLGVCGMGYNFSLVSLRAGFSILPKYGEEVGALETDDIIAAIDYAALMGIDVLNMSFGGSEYSSITQASCKNAVEHGVVLIAAAGNGTSNSRFYPAAYDGVISVSAVDYNDNAASFSNYGYWVDVAAPGVNIYSTVPKSGGVLHNSTGYSYLSGTSMAAPFVAGLAGLILSKNPSASPETVEYIIKNSLDEITGKSFYYGLGRINVLKALQLNVTEVPTMQISINNLKHNVLIKNNVNVFGTATGESFTLSIGLGVYPTTWTVLNTGTTTINGNLGTINVSSIPSGGYSVKLTTQTGGFQAETRTYIRITNDQDIKPGFPISFTTSPVAGKYLLIDDLDFDGKKEIIVCSRYGYIDIFYYDGSIYKSRPITIPEDGWVLSKPAIFDFDNDGKKEIVAVCHPGFYSSNFLDVFICAFDLDGKTLQGWPIYYVDGNYRDLIESVMVDDINNDGKFEIIVMHGVDKKCAMSILDINGNLLPASLYVFDEGYIGRSNPIIGDIDGDEEKEIVVTKFYDNAPNGSPHYIVALDEDGNLKTNYSYKLNNWGWATAGADVDNDNVSEIMTQDGLIGKNGNRLTWFLSNTNLYSMPTFADLTNDSKCEIFYGDADLGAYLTDYLGNTLPGWPVFKEKYSADGNHVIGDIDNDGNKEIIVGFEPNTVDSRDQRPGLNIFNASGKMITGFPKFDGIYYFNNYVIDDIDNNGLTDIVCMDDGDRIILAIEPGGSYNPNNQEWPTYLHDNRNTNNYNSSYIQPNLFNVKNIEIDEDTHTTARFSMENLDWENYITTVKADTSAIELIANRGTLSIIPQPDWNGSSVIRIFLEKENIVDSCKFILKVKPVDDVPADFSLITPSDSTLLELSTDKNKESLCFKWEKLNEKDNDPLIYSVSFDSPFNFLNTDVKETDSLSIPLIKLYNYMKEQGKWEYRIRWTVSCTDGKSKVNAKQKNALVISRINLAPGVFSLSLPPDSSIFNISANSIRDSINLKWYKATDKDDDTLRYAVKFDPPFNFLDSEFCPYDSLLIPLRKINNFMKENNFWESSINWSVLCTDGTIEVNSKENYTLLIKRINTAPEVFNLLSPADSSQISFSANNLEDSICFKWNRTYDVDGDTLQYTVVFNEPFDSLNFNMQLNDSLKVPFKVFYDCMLNKDLLNASLIWKVICSDGTMDVESLSSYILFIKRDDGTGVEIADNGIPQEYYLSQNYPNPFNPITTILYGLPKQCHVKIILFNVLGEELLTLVDKEQNAGFYKIFFDGTKYSSGIYFYSLISTDYRKTVKMILIK